jgi:uncharacterized protein
LRWSARGSTQGRDQVPHLDLAIDGDIALVCQRCLEPMRQPVAIASHFLIAKDEASAEALDDTDDFDVIAGAADFDLDRLIEDEVILALPIAPRHAHCPDDATARVTSAAAESPFAALAALKGAGLARPGNGGGGEGG